MEKELKIELLITPLFIILAILSIKYIGFWDIESTIFTIICIIEIPLVYLGLRTGRKLFYKVIRG